MPVSLTLALAAALLALLLTPLARRLAIHWGAIDHPGPRRIHAQPTPRMGGLAIAAAVLVAAWGARLALAPVMALEARPLLGYTLAALPIVALGLADDRWNVSPWVKLAIQTCAAIGLSLFGYGVPVLTNPFGPAIPLGWLNLPVTILWVLTVTNAVNNIDGLDGLASGVVIIACAALWVVARLHSDFYVMFFAALLIGACAGFLRWNFPPAKVFMGDTGSQFLGFTLATLSLLENRKGTAALTLLLPLVALGLPLVDTTLAFARRLVTRQHVFRGDASHIHHRVLETGLSPRGALFALWALCACFGLAAVLLTALPHQYAALLITVLGAVLFLSLEWLRTRRPKARESAARRK